MTLQEEFERCRAWLLAALEYNGGEISIDDVFAGIMSGQFLFLPGQQSAIVYEIHDHPKKRILNFVLAGGNLEELKRNEAAICRWAKSAGCASATIVGRKGWIKRLGGYREVATVMEKSLNE